MQQFWKNTEQKDSGCVEWVGAKSDGYGKFHAMSAHTFSYLLSNPDEDIDGFIVHHTCRNRACVNVEHLQILTRQDHMQLHMVEDGPQGANTRKIAKRASHCGRGHEFNEKNTGWQTDSDGYSNRYCTECKRENSIEFNKTKYVPHPKPAPTHCRQGHEYTPENTKYSVRANGGTKRYCRECNKIRAKANRAPSSN